MEDNRLLGQAEKVTVIDIVRSSICRGLLFDAGPGQINVEEEEKGAETDDRRLVCR